jgi:hypothetical protein
MAAAPPATDPSRRILDLSRTDRGAASDLAASLSLEEQVALVCDAPLALRGALLELMPDPDAVIPRLPEAELCFTVKAIGLADADWILAHATPEQVVASVDLDAWDGYELNLATLSGWLDALAQTPRAALMRAFKALDAELVVSLLRSRVEVWLKPAGDEDWQPPESSQTLEGQFYFRAIDPGDDIESVVSLLRALFESDYWTYFRMMQGVVWELASDTEEFALRWRTGRLQDLGFPPRDEALSIYGFLSPERCAMLPEGQRPFDVSEWHLPVWLPRLPAEIEERHRVFAAIARLPAEARRASFYAFVAVANKVAVADRMELSDAESIPRAIDKAAEFISAGLAHVSASTGAPDVEVLERATLEHLFRVGANLDPERARP